LLKGALQAVYEFSIAIRFTALGFSAVLPLIGAATVSAPLSGRQILGLIVWATALHIFGHVLNDVVDLPIDRTEPRRAVYPLVRGTMRPWQALALAFAQIPILVGLTAWLDGTAASYLVLAAAVVLTVIYDLWGKRVRWPIATDIVLGLAFAAFVLYGAVATAHAANSLTAAVMIFEVVFILMVNGVHGALRDLENDLRHKATTTAALLGARACGSELRMTPMLSAYATGLQVVLAVIAIVVGLRNDLAYRKAAQVITVVAVMTLSAGSLRLLRLALASGKNRANLTAIGMLHLILAYSPMLALFFLHADHRLAAIVITAYLLPLFAHEWLYDSMRWISKARSTQQILAAAQLVRLQNCLAAVLTTFLGAYLAAGQGAVTSATVLAVGCIFGLVVAACNVMNDYHDIIVDSINCPDRPIPSGKISPRNAIVMATTLAVSAHVGALRIGALWAGLALLFLVLGIGYTYYFKNTILVGNALIGMLCGGLVIAGAMAAGGIVPAAVVGAAFAFVFMFAYEVLNSLQDRQGDAKMGITTVATRLHKSSALRLFNLLELSFVVLSLAPWFLELATDRYLYLLLPCSLLPMLAILSYLNVKTTDHRIRISRLALKFVWFTTLIPMALLK
jgi:4-hydroxybenzoate polyprenyltransferase